MLVRTLKMAWYKRNRYALTVVAIALSVAFIVSTLLLTSSISNVGEPLSSAYQGVDAAVVGPQITESDGPVAGRSAPVPASVVDAIEAAGYEAVGLTHPYAQVLDVDGNPAGQDQSSSNVAEPWLGESDLNGFRIVEGVAPTAPGEFVLDVSTAADAGHAVGDPVTYVTDAGLVDGRLVGVATFGGADNDPYTATMLFDPSDPVLAVAPSGPAAGYDHVLVAGDASGSGSIVQDVESLVATAGVSELQVMDGATFIADQEAELNGFLGFFEVFLTVFAVIAVVVGMVIVANTFSVSLAQRTQELALLRLVGTTGRQVMGQVVVEALLLGVVGTAIGTALGIVSVDGLGWFLDYLGLRIERSSTIATGALVIGAAVGIGVTVAAAVWPARKATRVAPIEALRSAEVEPPSAGRNRKLGALVAVAAGAATLIVGAVTGDVLIAGIGVFGLFLSLYLGGEMLIRAVGTVARPFLGTRGPTGTLAGRNLERNAGRTAAASSALMIGVGLIAFFTLMAATIGQFVAGDAAEELRADYVVQGIGAFPEPSIPSSAVTALEATEGVSLVVPVRQVTVAPVDEPVNDDGGFGPGGGVNLGFADIDELTSVYDFEVVGGSLDDIDGAAVLVDDMTASAYGLAVGDSFALMTAAGPRTVDVAAIVDDSLPGVAAPRLIGAETLADEFGAAGPATTAFVLAPGVEEAQLTAALGLPTVDVATAEAYLDGLTSNLDTLLALVYAMLAVAVVIALVGIANTVSLAISERSAEIAAMRAAGASMPQIFWSLIVEYGLLALVGVASGLALAWTAATGLFQALSDGEILYPETSVVTGLVIAVVGLLGGALAAYWPSRTAARSEILAVLRAE